jgi:hypothetical protein
MLGLDNYASSGDEEEHEDVKNVRHPKPCREVETKPLLIMRV